MPASPAINKTVWETDLEEWRKVLRINLDGPFICCKAVVPAMIAAKIRPHRQHRLDRRQGRQSERRALFGLESRRDRADKIARQGTGAARHSGQRRDAGGGKDRDLRPDDAAHIDFMLSKIPKGRFVLVEELAAMVAWLASEDCAFSTGAVFDISGGRATY